MRWMLLLVVAGCGGETIEIGSNASAASAPAGLRCTAPASAIEPAPTSSPQDGLDAGNRLMTARWTICAGASAPPGLADALDLGPGYSFSLKRDDTGAFVHDAPLGITTAWSIRYETFEFLRPDQAHLLVWFEEAPLRMFVSSPNDPHTVIATYVVF